MSAGLPLFQGPASTDRPLTFDGVPAGTPQPQGVATQTVPWAEGGLCARLAAYFTARPGEWIDGRELATVAGAYAWRSRVSDLRRPPYNLTIENRQRRRNRFTIFRVSVDRQRGW